MEQLLGAPTAYIAPWQAVDAVELDIVEQMGAARWRLQRARTRDFAALDDELDVIDCYSVFR